MAQHSVVRCTVILLATATLLCAQRPSVNQVVDGIERHYNTLSSLQMGFQQAVEFGGQRRRAESGTLYLQRPGKMRWDYSQPEGKIAISDGTTFRMYNPHSNQVRQVELDAMTDLRAPLSFLLGRMRMRRMFRNLRIETSDGRTALIGDGRNARDVYQRVEFEFEPEGFAITAIRIVGRDESVNVYEFSQEQPNPKLSAALFDFEAPPGAEIVPLTGAFSDVPLE